MALAQITAIPNFAGKLVEHNLTLRRDKPTVLQINVGKLCNITCVHCHVNAGPGRKEIMTRQTVDKILDWLEPTEIPIVDLTGGAPEMIPDFKYLIREVNKQRHPRHIIDRCNLVILLEPGYEDLAQFLADNQVEVVASMPCYKPENVNAQRGEGVFDGSIKGLQMLNQLGYGSDPNLPLHLVYNPVGAYLPPDQAELEAEYKVELEKHFGIIFNQLYTITNLPISRFLSYLKRNGKLEEYMTILANSFNPNAVAGLMCRYTINIGWQGDVFDCDFNQMLDLPMENRKSRYLWELDWEELEGRPIHLGQHCYGCTAGAGSTCGGAIENNSAN